MYALASVQQWGSAYHWHGTSVVITPSKVQRVSGPIDCGQSGLLYRFHAALALFHTEPVLLVGHPALARRVLLPMLQQSGVWYCFHGADGVLIRGPTSQRVWDFRSIADSQLASAILFAASLVQTQTQVHTEGCVESIWLKMTAAWITKWHDRLTHSNGVWLVQGGTHSGFTYTIPSDFSLISTIVVAGILLGKEVLLIDPIDDLLQGDRQLLLLFKRWGVRWQHGKKRWIFTGRFTHLPELLSVQPFVDALPILTILAAAMGKKITYTDCAVCRQKESDRVAALYQSLYQAGWEVSMTEDRLMLGARICPTTPHWHGFDDHRIAMALSILGTVLGEGTLQQADAVRKTYPQFFTSVLPWLVSS